jgi:hypothetical protein
VASLEQKKFTNSSYSHSLGDPTELPDLASGLMIPRVPAKRTPKTSPTREIQ